jgi:nucleoside-triphosphatase
MLKVAKALERAAMLGFVTREIRTTTGRRQGFLIQALNGPGRLLAHVDSASLVRVGRYGVDIAALDEIVAMVLDPDPLRGGYLIDEIGKMECLSERFVAAVQALLDARLTVVATIAERGAGFIARVKRRDDVTLWEVTRQNRDELPTAVVAWLRGRRDRQRRRDGE